MISYHRKRLQLSGSTMDVLIGSTVFAEKDLQRIKF